MKIHQVQNLPIFITKIPKEIIKEIDKWVLECRKIKNHKLAYLKQHDNFGTNHNSFQISIPKKCIDDSFFLAFLNRFVAKCFNNNHRDYYLREWKGHFDGYDIWANFTYEGDDNPEHHHTGDISGVIYYKNDDTPTIFTKHNIAYEGKEETMIIFPANTPHKVDAKKSKKERITIAFNMNKVK
jgi:hypothetical protein